MEKWEYKVVVLNSLHQPDALEWTRGDDCGSEWLEKQLNDMGADGWQLVAFVPARPADYKWKHPLSEAEFEMAANPWLYNVIFQEGARMNLAELKQIENKTFGPNETVILDGHLFIDCIFDGCDMVFDGEADTAQIGCRTERPANVIIGGSAQRTLNTLKSLGFRFISPFGDEPQETSLQ
jgi:hypothetical protein